LIFADVETTERLCLLILIQVM